MQADYAHYAEYAEYITADGAYLCPVGSIWLFLALYLHFISLHTYLYLWQEKLQGSRWLTRPIIQKKLFSPTCYNMLSLQV